MNQDREMPDRMIESYRKAPLTVRCLCATFLAGVFVLLLYPYGGDFYPEGNWLRGPLWLLNTQRDRQTGVVITLVLTPMLFSPAVWQNLTTAVLALIGGILWIGFGAYLAILAVV